MIDALTMAIGKAWSRPHINFDRVDPQGQISGGTPGGKNGWWRRTGDWEPGGLLKPFGGEVPVSAAEVQQRRIDAFIRKQRADTARRWGGARDARNPYDATDLALQALARMPIDTSGATSTGALFGVPTMLGGGPV